MRNSLGSRANPPLPPSSATEVGRISGPAHRDKVLLAVTTDSSLDLLGELPAGLISDGWDVHIIANPGPRLRSIGELPFVTAHPVDMRREPAIVRDVWSLCRWIAVLGRVRPDVVSAGTPKAGFLGMVAAKLMRTPHRVYVLRGLRLENERGLRLALLTVLEKITALCATNVIAVSPSLRAVYLDKRLASPTKIRVLGSGSSKGVDGFVFRPALGRELKQDERFSQQIGLVKSIPVVGLFGRQTEDKGLDVFFEAVNILWREKVNFQVLIAGDDESSGNLELLESMALGTVIRLPRVDNLARYYRLLDVFCLPTLREGLPNVVLEAQATGVPVVTTDATGAIDSIAPGKTGIIAKAGDSHSLATALSSLLGDVGLRGKLGSQSRAWVWEEFGSGRVTSLHRQFYRSLLLRQI